jgi:hypothetical protein
MQKAILRESVGVDIFGMAIEGYKYMAKASDIERETQSEQREAKNDVAPIAGPPTATIPEKPPNDPNSSCLEKIRRWTNDPGMFLLTFATLIVLGIYTAFTGLLVFDAKDATQRQLRAYIVVTSARFAKDEAGRFKLGVTAAGGSGELLIYYDVSNEGITPAYDVFRRITVEYPFKGVFNFNYTDGTAAYISKKVTFGPVRTRGMTKEEVEAISTGKTPLAFAGQITYRDIFNREWPTNFCFIYAAAPVEPSFVSCPRFSGADRLNYAR